jgi:hypothetical protein
MTFWASQTGPEISFIYWFFPLVPFPPFTSSIHFFSFIVLDLSQLYLPWKVERTWLLFSFLHFFSSAFLCLNYTNCAKPPNILCQHSQYWPLAAQWSPNGVEKRLFEHLDTSQFHTAPYTNIENTCHSLYNCTGLYRRPNGALSSLMHLHTRCMAHFMRL